MCFSPFLQLWVTSCVCLLYLVYLLKESRLPEVAASIQVFSVMLPACCVHAMQFVPSRSSHVRPVVRVDSTCVHLQVYLQQSSHSTSCPSDLKQTDNLRQPFAASLSQTSTNRNELTVSCALETRDPSVFFPAGWFYSFIAITIGYNRPF